MKPTLLIVEQRMLGDAVMSLLFVRAAMPRYEVFVTCAPWSVPIFAALLPPERILPWHPPWLEDLGKKYQPTRWLRSRVPTFIRSLRRLNPQVAVSVWADTRVHSLMALTGAPVRVGFPMNEGNYYAHHLPWRRRQLRYGQWLDRVAHLLNRGPLLTQPLQRHHYEQHHVETWKQIARELQLPWDDRSPWLTISRTPLPADIEQAIQRARQAGQPVWLIHPGARVQAQRWPRERFLSVIRGELKPAGAACILLDAPEAAWPDAIRGEFPVARLDTLQDLLSLLSAGDALLCNDTGVSHLAAALGKHVVTLFFASNPHWFGPWGPGARTVTSKACPLSPCLGLCLQPRLICHDPDLEPEARQAVRDVNAEIVARNRGQRGESR